jgi:hypothetical protein
MPPVAQHLDEMSVASSTISVGYYKPSSHAHESRPTVGFDDSAMAVYEFEAVSFDIHDDVWYSKEDYDIIKARNSLIVKLMKADCFEENDDHTFRGLEHKLKKGYRGRRANKFNALNAVLEEQDSQMVKGLSHPELISEAYIKVSGNARETALLLGLQDAEEQGGCTVQLVESPSVDDDDDCCSVVSEISAVSIASTTSPKRRRNIFRLRRKPAR